MLLFKRRQPGLIGIHLRFQILQLPPQPSGVLRRGSHSAFVLIFLVGVNQPIHNCSRQRRILGAKSYLQHQRSGQRLHQQLPLEPHQQPLARASARSLHPESGKFAGKPSSKSGRIIKLQLGNHPPSQPLTAEHVRQRLKL